MGCKYVGVVSLAVAAALDNGFVRPQMGYNSWYDVGMSPSEELMKSTMDAMASTGLLALGYKYANLDDGWSQVNRSSNVRFVSRLPIMLR